MEIRPCVVERSHKCLVCGTTVFEANWCWEVVVDGKVEYIHDNENVCLNKLFKKFGMPCNSFLESRPVL